jgi:hypothetical protein
MKKHTEYFYSQEQEPKGGRRKIRNAGETPVAPMLIMI